MAVVGRAIRWLIALALIAIAVLWPLVVHRQFLGRAGRRPGDLQRVPRGFPRRRRRQPGRHGDHHRRVPERPARPFPLLGHRQPEQPPGAAEAGDHLDPDGRQSDQYQVLSEGGGRFRVAKIGDPDRYLDWGTHIFEIRYTIPGVLDPGDTGARKEFASSAGQTADGQPPSVFFWNVVAPSWNNSIDRADITVTLPAAITGAQCSVGTGVGMPATT